MHSIRPKRPGTQMFQRQTSLTKTNFCLFGLHLSACREEISGYWCCNLTPEKGGGRTRCFCNPDSPKSACHKQTGPCNQRLSPSFSHLWDSFFIWINVVRKSYCLPRKQRLLNQEFFVTKALIFLSKDLKNHLAI